MNFYNLLIIFSIFISFIFTFHGIFTLACMLYAWDNPEDVKKHKSPKKFALPKFSFTALIPARHEEEVIEDTIKAVDNIDYPENLKEVLVLCRKDDIETIAKARKIIKKLGKKNIKVVVFDSFPINKPHSLNQGLKEAKNEVIAVFDAEDEPHRDIYHVVNSVLKRDKTDIVQSGVQLMNYRSHWFSALNVVEYFFWFKSGLHFLSKFGRVAPLGGNTVFFKKKWLEKIGGWDENCLTEDADVALRLVSAGAKVSIVYDEEHVTREETPSNIRCFIKQRTRWNQGFMQSFLKGDWRKLSKLRQKLLAGYILLSPIIQTILWLYMPIGIFTAFTQKLPIAISLFSFLPLYLSFLQLLVFIVGLYEFTKIYRLEFPFWMPLKVLLTFYPYQLMLLLSSFRAFFRVVASHNSWEKTLHLNAHRKVSIRPLFVRYAK